jgi:transcriptional regulator with XRE-family HTH domain
VTSAGGFSDCSNWLLARLEDVVSRIKIDCWFIFTTLPGMGNFGQKLKDLRIGRGLTLRVCADTLHVDPSNWSKMERGINPAPKDPDVLHHWADFFGVEDQAKEDFLDLAALSRSEIPADITSDKVLSEALPVFFRAARGAEISSEKLEKFVAEVKKLHSPDT